MKKVNYILIILAFIITINVCSPPREVNAFGLTGTSVALLGSMFPYVAGGVLLVAGVTMAYKEYKSYKKQKLVEAMENFTSDEVKAINEWSSVQSDTEVNTSDLPCSVVQKMKDVIINNTESNYVDVDREASKEFEEKCKTYVDRRKQNLERYWNENPSVDEISITSTFVRKDKGYINRGGYNNSIYISSTSNDCFLYKIDVFLKGLQNETYSFYCWFVQEGSINFLAVGSDASNIYSEEVNTKSHIKDFIFVPGLNIKRSRAFDNVRGNEGDKSICIPRTFNPSETDKSIDRTKDVTFPSSQVRDMDRDMVFEVPFSKDKISDGQKVGDKTNDKPIEKPVDPTKPVSWDWLKNLLKEILDAIKSIPGLMGDIVSLLKNILNAIKSLATPTQLDMSVPNKIELDFSPLYINLKEKFPFCIPFDIVKSIKSFSVNAKEPVFVIPLSKTGWKGAEDFTIDLTGFEKIIIFVRYTFLVSFLFYLLNKTRSLIRG